MQNNDMLIQIQLWKNSGTSQMFNFILPIYTDMILYVNNQLQRIHYMLNSKQPSFTTSADTKFVHQASSSKLSINKLLQIP